MAPALAGLRANEARYFKNKYDHDFTVEPAGEATETVDWVHRILKEERDIVIASRPLEATEFQVENIRMAYVFYESGLSINVLYTLDDATQARRRVQALRRHGGPRRARLAVQVRTPEVEAGRDHPRLVLRDQGRVLIGPGAPERWATRRPDGEGPVSKCYGFWSERGGVQPPSPTLASVQEGSVVLWSAPINGCCGRVRERARMTGRGVTLRVGRRNGPHHQIVDPCEVDGIRRVERQAVRDGGGGDQRVEGAGGRLAPGPSVRRGDDPEGTGGRGIKRDRIEVGLGLLDVGQATRTLRVVGGHQGSDGELRQGDGRDQRDIGKGGRILQTAERQ